MITEAVANWFLSIVAWLIALIPPLPGTVGTNLDQYEGRLDQVLEQVSYLSPVVPFDAIAQASLTLSVFIMIATVMQVSRIVVSVATLGGGSV